MATLELADRLSHNNLTLTVDDYLSLLQEKGRLALLEALKTAGVTSIKERQAIANAVAANTTIDENRIEVLRVELLLILPFEVLEI